jgi:hypothetical protein
LILAYGNITHRHQKSSRTSLNVLFWSHIYDCFGAIFTIASADRVKNTVNSKTQVIQDEIAKLMGTVISPAPKPIS